MSRVIAVCNLKGGAGKSTIAVNLACELNAVLVDADSQATASMWCELGTIPIAHERLPIENDRGIDRWIQKIKAIAETKAFVVIDCPPQLGNVSSAAVGFADCVLIPCTASSADLAATETAVDLVRRARTNRTEGPRCLIVPSKVDLRTSSGREIPEALKRFGERIGPTVHQRAAFVDSLGSGYWIGEYAPNGPAHQDIAALSAAVRRLLK